MTNKSIVSGRNVGHSSSELISHLTIPSLDAIMRQNKSVVHHIYYTPALHHEEVSKEPNVAIQAVNNESRRWRRILFPGGNSNETAVWYSWILYAYYLIDGTGTRRQVTLTKHVTTNLYYFEHPEL